jgi:type IV fimbrial biogenesis protein FimT
MLNFKTPSKRDAKGFTLIELMVGLAILAMLLMIGLPEMQVYSQNAKIRKTAESFAADIMVARAEAIRTNDPTVFILTANAPAADPTSVTASATGPNWFASIIPGTGSPRLIVSKLGGETSGKPIDISTSTVANAKIQFNGLGITNLAGAAAYRFTNAQLNPDCELSQAIRCLQVEVSIGGKTRICEPGRASAAATSASDTRVCTVGG